MVEEAEAHANDSDGVARAVEEAKAHANDGAVWEMIHGGEHEETDGGIGEAKAQLPAEDLAPDAERAAQQSLRGDAHAPAGTTAGTTDDTTGGLAPTAAASIGACDPEPQRFTPRPGQPRLAMGGELM